MRYLKIIAWTSFLIFIAGLFILFSVNASAWAETLNDKLTTYWNFNESSGIKASDIITGRYNTTLVDMEDSDWVSGRIGNALNFSGSSNEHANVSDSNFYAGGKNFSISFWIKSEIDSLGAQYIVDFGNSQSRGFAIWLVDSSHLLFSVGRNSTTTSIQTPYRIAQNVWLHVVATYNNDTNEVKLYLNGTEVITTIRNDYASSAGDFLKIAKPLADEKWFGGSVDEMAFWDGRVLTSSEINTLWNNGSGITFEDSPLFINSQSYNSTTYMGATESFFINITYDDSYWTSISANLIYNSTSYSGTKIGSGSNVVYSSSIVIPIVSAQTNKSFYWQLILTNSSGYAVYYNSSSYNQTIGGITFDNCSSYTTNLFNFTLFDEDERNQINGTIEALVNLYTYNTLNLVHSFNKSFDFIANQGNARICTSGLNSTYSIDYQLKYYGNSSSYSTEYKHGQRLTVNNNTATQHINLYSLLSSRATVFEIIIQGANLAYIDGGVVDVQRQYIPINQFISVESPLTDIDGKATAHLVANDIYYNFVISKNGTVLGTFNNYRVKCADSTTNNCRFTLNLIQATVKLDNYKSFGNITTSFNFDRTSRLLTMNYLSVDGLTHTVKWNVIKRDNFANNTICTNTNAGTSGSFSCTVPSSYGNASLYAEVYSDGEFIGRSFYSLQQDAGEIFGGIRVMLGLLMYSTLSLMMTFHPIGVVVGSILGMGFASAFFLIDGGTFFGTSAILIWFIVAGGIIIFRIWNRT